MRELIYTIGWFLTVGAMAALVITLIFFPGLYHQLLIPIMISFFVSFILMGLTENPWLLFQLIFITIGGCLGIYAGQVLEVPDEGQARAAKMVGAAGGLIIAYLATWALSRIIDWRRSRHERGSSPDLWPVPKARGSDLAAREDPR